MQHIENKILWRDIFVSIKTVEPPKNVWLSPDFLILMENKGVLSVALYCDCVFMAYGTYFWLHSNN